MAHDHEKITYGMDDVKELFDASVLIGTIVSVDTDNDKAHVNISGFGQINDVPIFYHCPGSDVVEGGSAAFSDGDSVYILNKEGRISPGASDLQIVGLVDGLRSCGWEEEWGETICQNHQWYVKNYNNTEKGLCLDPLPEEFSIMLAEPPDENRIIKCDPSAIVVGWNVDRTPDINWGSPWGEPKIGANRYLTLKIATHYACIDCGPAFVDSTVAMLINTDTEWLQLNFEETTGHPHQPREYYIGDNGGAEQVIDLHSYGLAGSPIWSIKFWVNLLCPVGAKESGGFELDYLRLS